jgi:hypothetical protein
MAQPRSLRRCAPRNDERTECHPSAARRCWRVRRASPPIDDRDAIGTLVVGDGANDLAALLSAQGYRGDEFVA